MVKNFSIKHKILAVFLTLIAFFSAIGASHASIEKWKKLSSGLPSKAVITSIAGGDDLIYIGTERGLYVLKNKGKKWKEVKLPGENISVSKVAVLNRSISVSSRSGLYLSSDGRKWLHIPGKRNLKGALFLPSGETAVWTIREILKLKNGDYFNIAPEVRSSLISDVCASGSFMYAGIGSSIFYSSDGGGEWKRRFISFAADEDVILGSEIEDTEELAPAIRDLESMPGEKVLITTGKGLFIFDPKKESMRRIDTKGLPSSSVKRSTVLKEGFLTSTDSKVFYLKSEYDPWETIFENTSGERITDLFSQEESGKKCLIFISTERNIYRSELKYKGKSWRKRKSFKVPQGQEPTVKEVQRMAIEYAEVSPEKIKRWRRAASWRAILPRLSVGYSESFDDNIEIYKNSSTSYAVVGPREHDNDWGVDLTWNLSDLIWADAQTSIDTRSKLMVQLRDDILEDVTRLYFERKRLLAEIERERSEEESKKISEKHMRVEELTGYIDALTGGKFSESLGK